MRHDLVVHPRGGDFVQPKIQIFSQVVQENVNRGVVRIERINRTIEHDLRTKQFGELRGERWIVQHRFQRFAQIVDHAVLPRSSAVLCIGWSLESVCIREFFVRARLLSLQKKLFLQETGASAPA